MKIFRKIRSELLEKNQTGKYLKYAVGEIILLAVFLSMYMVIRGVNNFNK